MGYFMIVAIMGAYPIPLQPPVQPRFARPAIVTTKPKTALKPGQGCAIPLLNVLRPNWGRDPMTFRPRQPPPQQMSKDFVQPPSPSCDDVR